MVGFYVFHYVFCAIASLPLRFVFPFSCAGSQCDLVLFVGAHGKVCLPPPFHFFHSFPHLTPFFFIQFIPIPVYVFGPSPPFDCPNGGSFPWIAGGMFFFSLQPHSCVTLKRFLEHPVFFFFLVSGWHLTPPPGLLLNTVPNCFLFLLFPVLYSLEHIKPVSSMLNPGLSSFLIFQLCAVR